MSKENPNELKIINKNERLKYQKLLYKYKQQIAELQKQLEEKDKEILELQEESIRDNQNYNEELADCSNYINSNLH